MNNLSFETRTSMDLNKLKCFYEVANKGTYVAGSKKSWKNIGCYWSKCARFREVF